MDEASADLLRRLSRAAGSLRATSLVVTHAIRRRLGDPAGDDDLRCLVFTLLPLSEREAAEIVEIATDEQPLPTARGRGARPALRRQPAVPLRAARRRARDRDDGVAAGLGRGGRRGGHRPALAVRPDRAPVRVRARRRASIEALLAATLRRARSRSTRRSGSGCAGSSTATPTAGCASATRSSATPPTRASPFRRRRELHARVAEAIEAAAASLEDEAPTLALHFSEAQRHEQGMALRPARPATAPGPSPRTSRRRGSTSSRSPPAARVRDVDDRGRARRSRSRSAPSARPAGSSTRRSRRSAVRRGCFTDDPVEQARVYALRARVRASGPGSYPARAPGDRRRPAPRRRLESSDAVAARAALRAMRGEIRWLQGHPREAIATRGWRVEDAAQRGVSELEALASRLRRRSTAPTRCSGEPEQGRARAHVARDLRAARTDRGRVGIQELNLGVQALLPTAAGTRRPTSTGGRKRICSRAGDRQDAAVAGLQSRRAARQPGRARRGGARAPRRAAGASRRRASIPFALFAETQLARCALERGDVDGAARGARPHHRRRRQCGLCRTRARDAVYFAQAEAMAGRAGRGPGRARAGGSGAGEEAALYAAPLDRARAACLRVLGRVRRPAPVSTARLAAAEAQGQLYEQLLARRACEGAPLRAGPRPTRSCARSFASRSSSVSPVCPRARRSAGRRP